MRGFQALSCLSYNLRRIRQDLGITQATVATRAGFHQQYISNLERGLLPAAAKHVAAIAAALGVPESEMYRRRRRVRANHAPDMTTGEGTPMTTGLMPLETTNPASYRRVVNARFGVKRWLLVYFLPQVRPNHQTPH
jgi:transcriptional regulator with XRE-family HTH domain